MMSVFRNIGVRARLMMLIAAAMLPLIGLIATGLFVSYRDAELEAHRNISNEARLGASRIARIFEEAESFLATLRHSPQIRGLQQPSCDVMLAGLKAERPMFMTIGVVSPDGVIRCHSKGVKGSHFGDQNLVQRAMNARGAQFLVGDFMIGAITKKPTVAVAMRLPPTAGVDKPGLVFASLNLPLVENEIREISQDSGHSVAIVQPRSSRILVNWPHDIDFGSVTPDFQLLSNMPRQPDGGTMTTPDRAGVPHLFGFEPIDNAQTAGLWLAIGVPTSEVFANVQQRSRWALLTGILVVVVALGGAALLAYWTQIRPIAFLSRSAQRIGAGDFTFRTGLDPWQAPEFQRLGKLIDTAARTLAKTQAAEAAAATSERRFRLVADNTADMISCLDTEGRRTLVTGASRIILGYDPQELIGGSPADIALPEDRMVVDAILEGARGGHAVDGARYRVLRKDGRAVWVEVSGRPMADGSGFVISMRDVDNRQRTEAALAEANRQLELLAATDELTHLANRRTFNRRLEEAFARTDAGRGELSLLLVDVDRFKAFNDRYGHPAGDRCLEAISKALAACIRHDDEIGARYGGEELALILPGLGLAEAMVRAEIFRRAVTALDIPHADGDGGRVTVSIGVASRSRLPTGSGAPADLLQMADEALYEAKAGGRNQVRTRAA